MEQADVAKLITDTFGVVPTAVELMDFGHASTTYKVDTPDQQLIVRTNTDPSIFLHTAENLEALRALGIPVPRLLAADLSGSRNAAAFLILECIPGRDLRFELPSMNIRQQRRLAGRIVEIQRKAASLPHESGYGYAAIHQNGPSPSWAGVVESQLASPSRTDIPRLTHLTRAVKEGIGALMSELSTVPATCFLDDLTIKNAIVKDGVLQGVVDFDLVCFGDPLFWIALTAVAVVSDLGEESLTYVDELRKSWGVGPRSAGRVALYTRVHCQRFIARGAASEGPAWADRMFSYAERQTDTAI